MNDTPCRLSVVVPCYNEEDVFPETVRRLTSLLERLVASGKISAQSQAVFVDDGSRDATWALIEEHASRDARVAGIKLSRNRGHQNALLAGLFTVDGDAVVSIDADLQDDVDAIETMVDHFISGSEVVYGVRKLRAHDTAFKRGTALTFYRLMRLLGTDTLHNHADYRLLSRRAVEALKSYREINLFIRGIVPLIGFRSSIVYYDRHLRFAGESKYPLKKMVEFALDAITSFSVAPLRLITAVGFIVFAVTMALSIWTTWVAVATDRAVPGWASTLLPILFLGGLQILCLGVMGEYLGKIYVEVKSRPRYIIESTVRLAPASQTPPTTSADAVRSSS
jgi:glycosyltransferase involved in cell wall biosynthesis